MKRGLQSFVFLFVLLFVLSGLNAFGQNESDEEIIERIKKYNNSLLLKGASATIDDLDVNYCSDAGVIDIYVNPDEINSNTDFFIWNIFTYVAGVFEDHPDWFTSIGTAPNNGIAFDLSQIEEEFFGNNIYIEYRPVEGGELQPSVMDHTVVYKVANVYTFGSDMELCHNSPSQKLTLANSEDGYEYFLFKDGVQQSGLTPEGQDGTPIDFSISTSEIGTSVYTVEARRKDTPLCTILMDGAPEVTIYPVPDPDPQSNSPICQNEDIQLFDGNSSVSGYQYIWKGPGLPIGGQNGHSITVSDPSVIGTPGDYTYDLTIVDTNNPTNCDATESVVVTINQGPTIDNISNNGPLCIGETLGLSVTVSGGSGPYTYSWTGPNGFTSTDEDPVLSNVTLVDAGTYEVVVTDANGCGSTTASTVVTVNENPVIDAISNDGPVCESGTVNLSVTVIGGSGPYTYLWTGPNGFTSTDEDPVLSNITLADAGSYEVVVT
ncbi:MAG: trimeric autotransporter adhesin, partial [Anaerophaga sp.]|nr:trimeric autotransporter adhesin [Anaerophaga sp.]